MAYLWSLAVLFVYLVVAVTGGGINTVILAVKNSNSNIVLKKMCALTYTDVNDSLPQSSGPVQWQHLAVPTDQWGCNLNSKPKQGTSALLVKRGNCSFYDKAVSSHRYGCNLTVVTNGKNNNMSYTVDNRTHPLIDGVRMVLVSYADGQWLWSKAYPFPEIQVSFYTSPPNDVLVIPSLLVVSLVALVTIISGSIWAQCSAEFLNYGLLWRKGEIPLEEDKNDKGKWWHRVLMIGVVMVTMVTVLLLLYFFWSVMIYLAVAMFTIAATTSVFSVVSPIVALIPFMSTWRIPEHRYLKKIPILKHQPDPRFFITLGVIVCFTVWWAVERNSSYAWILLLILGYFIIITIYRSWRRLILKLWIFTVVLVAFFLYDIFFVYVTRLFTPDGESVMEKVAVGFESRDTDDCEMLPFAFKIPRFLNTEQTNICSEYLSCLRNYVILGFGDVALPGLLVSYCLYVDLTYHAKRKFKVYFTVAVTGYMVGLIATFIALEVMKSGQPALLFLVPSTLIPTLITAAAHWELKQLWIGSGSDMGESKSVTFKELKEREDMEEETELEEFEEHKTFKRGQVDSDSDIEVYSRGPEAAVRNDDTVDEDSDSEDKQLIPSTTTGP